MLANCVPNLSPVVGAVPTLEISQSVSHFLFYAYLGTDLPQPFPAASSLVSQKDVGRKCPNSYITGIQTWIFA